MDYLSFDLRLGEWNPKSRTGVAEVLQSPAGEGERYSFLLGEDIASCISRTDRTPAMAIELGRKLCETLLSQESLTLWHESYQIARERRRGLRFRLRIDSWELSRLPWELLYDARRGDFLVFDHRVSLVRYVRLHAAPPALRRARSVKVVAVVASPDDGAPLDWEREVRVLREGLREMVDAGQVEIILCEHTTHEKLHLALLENTPDVVHFIGHAEYNPGKRQGFLHLENEDSHALRLGASEAARMFRRYRTNLVVLNACDTATGAWAGLAPALVRAEIPAVVAMQWPVEDQAAIRFTRLFYKALSLGKTIDECVAEGRLGVSAGGSDPNDWAAPVLFLRSLSGQLWTSDVSGTWSRTGVVSTQETAATRTLAPEDEGYHFRTRGPLLSTADPELIIERPELRRALRIARQPSITQYVAFLGARQTGKTTLLFHLMHLLKAEYACIFVDLSVLRFQDARACYRFLAFRLISEFREMLGSSFTLSETSQLDGSVEFLRFLRKLADVAPMARIIILLDEVGALSPEASDSFFNTLRTVFTQGRGLIGNLAKYLFVFSGAVDLYALTFGTNSPLNICEKLYLRDFELPDVQKIVSQFSKLGFTVSEGAPARVHELTGGHPYLTMRLCALVERAGSKEVTPEQVEAAAEEMLVEDDSIRHLIHELERRPLERRRLRGILIESRESPFSRNDPVLASLEMIGAIRPVQPCQVRNRLFERALLDYYARIDRESAEPGRALASEPTPEQVRAMYARLQSLRGQALDAGGAYKRGKAWETFAAALFSAVPAFSVYPDVADGAEELDVILAINGSAPGGRYWSIYLPAILIECKSLLDSTPQDVASGAFRKANQHDIRLVFVMTTGGATPAGDQESRYSGAFGNTYVVLIDDAEIGQLLERRGDLDAFLRSKVLDVRLGRT